MITAARLSLRLLAAGGRRAWTSAALLAAGVAVATALAGLAVTAVGALDARDARAGWRTPDVAAAQSTSTRPPGAVALLRTHLDVVAGAPLTRVDLVDPRPDAPAPPGLPRMPAPGEVWLSPALAVLPAGGYPGPVTGLIGPDGLVGPDELVAVVGHPAGAGGPGPLVAVTGFDRPVAERSGTGEVYRQLMVVAAVLVLFPALGLLGASARLTATRREERLATLALLGASRVRITVVALTDVAVVGLAGAVAGVSALVLGAPLPARIPLAGSTWFVADLRPSPVTAVGLVVLATAVVVGSAAAGLRRVVVGPLGVVRRSRPRRARLVRLLGLGAAVVVFAAVNSALQDSPLGVAGPVFAIGVLGLLGAIGLVGPVVVQAAGAAMLRRPGSVAALLAGRRLCDDPRGAFRPLAGLTLAVFVAGFVAPLTGSVPGALDPQARLLLEDCERGAVVVLVLTFLTAATATGTAAASRVLDHRHTLRLLRLAGTPPSVLDAARRTETVVPLLATAGLALLLGLLCAAPFAAASAALAPRGLVVLGAVLLGGVLTVWASAAASRPLLRAVTAPEAERAF